MVKQVSAWEASDGSVHPSAFTAAEHEAKTILASIGELNPGNIAAIINNREKIWDAVGPLIALEHEEAHQ